MQQNAGCVSAFSPRQNSRVRTRGDPGIWRTGAKQNYSKANWIHPRHDLFHSQILRIRIALISKRGRENRHHVVDKKDGMITRPWSEFAPILPEDRADGLSAGERHLLTRLLPLYVSAPLAIAVSEPRSGFPLEEGAF